MNILRSHQKKLTTVLLLVCVGAGIACVDPKDTQPTTQNSTIKATTQAS